MHECDKVRSFISDFIEGDLHPHIRKEVETHLKICTDCNEVAYQVRVICRSLQSLPQISTSADFEQRLHSQINTMRQFRFPFLSSATQSWKIPAVGSVVILATIGLFIVFNPTRTRVGNTSTIESSSLTPGSVQLPTQSSTIDQLPYPSAQAARSVVTDTIKKDSAGYFKKEGVKLVGEH